ncbi:hypothetical protein, partial [Blautia producta]|uniref:hypothetical protein n=1 Tax=Blautia producta TaxID=33035 RepID=UPI0031B642C2
IAMFFSIRSQETGRGGDKVQILFDVPRPSANLLPVAKFVGIGLLINQLGQVDLRAAPLNLRSSEPCPLLSLFPGCGWKKTWQFVGRGRLMYFC